MTPEIKAIIDRLNTDLNWRGPNGKTLGHIVIPRHDAITLANYLKTIEKTK